MKLYPANKMRFMYVAGTVALLLVVALLCFVLPFHTQQKNHNSSSDDVIQHAIVSSRLRIPVLMYHHVGYLPTHPDNIRKDLTVSPEDFESQISFLHAHGYVTVSLQEVRDAVLYGKSLPPKSIALTFDDGYKDVFVYALPALKKYHMTGSLAIAPGLLGAGEYASWDDVSKAKADGFEVVSHTYSHVDSTSQHKLSSGEVYNDYKKANEEFEKHLGFKTDILVYPYGHYNLQVMEIAKKTGYNIALTTKFGVEYSTDHAYELPRVRVHGKETLERFADLLDGKLDTTKASTSGQVSKKSHI